MTVLNKDDLKQVAGGIPNPVAGLSYDEAMKKAKELGPERKDMGTWRRMSDKDYIRWWRNSNQKSKEYLDHQKEVDDFLGNTLDSENAINVGK